MTSLRSPVHARPRRPGRAIVAALALAALCSGGVARAGAAPARAHEAPPAILKEVGFDQRLNAQAPLALIFRDEGGRAMRLGDAFRGKPVILSLVYFNCATLCPMILDGLVRSLTPVSFDIGKEFTMLTVSFDPRDTPAAAAAKKAEYVGRYRRPGAGDGWHFLTGEEAAIQGLTQAVGFRYAFDARTGQFAHAAGILILTPQGKVARYFYGFDLPPRDLRLALVEAAAGKIGTPIDQLLLYCYQYDPLTGRYGLIMMNVLRLAGLGTILALGSGILLMLRRERQARRNAKEAR
ncbi:MAG: SCO family protein [candidate division NC10 bacterium]|nr:SCO family protein [candidate division NC10 bacterium]